MLAQLGNRVQHALRAFTPDDAKALQAAVSTFPKSGYDLEELLTDARHRRGGRHRALRDGRAHPVAWTRLRAPESLMAPVAPATRWPRSVAASPLQAEYGQALDRESAYERLRGEAGAAAGRSAPAGGPRRRRRRHRARAAPRRGSEREEPSVVEQVVSSPVVKCFLRSAGTALGREITRSLFGTATKRRR